MNRLQFPMMIIHPTFEHNYTSTNIKPQALREPARHKRQNYKSHSQNITTIHHNRKTFEPLQ